MHLLAATPGAVSDGSEAVDLGQTPGDIVILSAADTELASLARARAVLDAPDAPRVRLANLMHLAHNMSVDLYVDAVVRHARLVVVRVLGGQGYWPYGLEQVAAACAETGAALCVLPGDDQPDPDLDRLSTMPADDRRRLWQYLIHGGPDNAEQSLRFAFDRIGYPTDWLEPRRWCARAFTGPARARRGWKTCGRTGARTRSSARWCFTARWFRRRT
jgi:cobaltochelatase CobN